MRLFNRRARTSQGIILHEEEDFASMRGAGEVTARILDEVSEQVRPGVTSNDLDRFVMERIEAHGVKSGTMGYRGYRHATCISVNSVACHGVPNDRKLRPGDILNIDVTVIRDGWYGDSSRMYVAGAPDVKSRRLMQVTHDALFLGLEQVKPGRTTGDIGHVIDRYVRKHRMSIIRVFTGHGVGRNFHQEPSIFHFGALNSGVRLEEGMFFTVEPIVSLGSANVSLRRDGWTAVTTDRSRTAQFEHAVGVTSDGCEIFTLSPANRYHPTNFSIHA